MSSYKTLRFGIDETQPAPVFVRLVSPTDIQKVSARMSAIIKDYHEGLDILNPYLWSVLGMSTLSGPVVDFLTRLVGLQRERKDSLTKDTAAAYILLIAARFPEYSTEQIKDYVNSYLQCMSEGVVPESIVRPYDYHPSSAAEDAAAVATSAVKSLAPWLVGGAVVYMLITAGIPSMIGNLLSGAGKVRKR